MQLLFYKNNILVNTYHHVKCDNHCYEINDDDVLMKITTKPDLTIIRENKEYYFKLDIKKNTCIYKLKDYNLTYDIDIIKSSFTEKSDELIIEYELNTDDSMINIVIKNEE